MTVSERFDAVGLGIALGFFLVLCAVAWAGCATPLPVPGRPRCVEAR